MLKWLLKKQGASALEYMSLLIFIVAAFIAIQKYTSRGLAGKWKQAGDTFGQEHQYDPRWHTSADRGTRSCFYDKETALWVNTRCFRQNCDCSTRHSFPPDQVVPDPSLGDICTPCIQSCSQNNPNYADCADDVN